MNGTDIRDTVVGSVGPRAVHAFEDGFVMMFFTALFAAAPGVSTFIASGLGLSVKKIVAGETTELVRKKQAEENPEFFIAGTAVGLGVGVAVGEVVLLFNVQAAV